MNLETLNNGAVRCPDDPGEPGYGVLSQRISVTPEETRILRALALDRRVLEIGTGLGVSTRAMAETAAMLVTVDCDPWVHEHVVLPGGVLRASTVEDYEVDLVFIDGLHTPDAVRTDIQSALRVLRPRGIIVFHDIDMPCVRDTVVEVLGTCQELAPNLGWARV